MSTTVELEFAASGVARGPSEDGWVAGCGSALLALLGIAAVSIDSQPTGLGSGEAGGCCGVSWDAGACTAVAEGADRD